MTIPEFNSFSKIARLSREIVVTEKIDGTNAQVRVWRDDEGELQIVAGSRSQWITPKNDNHGFAKWVQENKEELLLLGEGCHFGEWWGSGIQRGYGLKGEKRFSLFNVRKWGETRPPCCSVVPMLYMGIFDTCEIDSILRTLEIKGSFAAPGFMKPEGVVIYHPQGDILFKKTIEKDEEWKGKHDSK